MSMASAAPFSGLSRPANSAPCPAVPDQGMTPVGGYGGRIASTGTTRRQALAWKSDTAATAGGLALPATPTQRRRHRLVRRQVERVHHRRLQRRREPDGGRVEGVIVDHVIPGRPHGRIGGGEGGLGRCRGWLGLLRFARGWPGRPVERARQRPGIDSGVDHLDPRDLRSGGGVDVHVVAPAGQAAGQIGHERLRAAALRLPDGRHQRRHDRDLHPASTLKARSRGGLMPSTSKGTSREPRRRTSSAALG